MTDLEQFLRLIFSEDYVVISLVVVWVLVSVIIAQVGGWAQLARHYRAAAPFTGKRWWMQSASMRWRTGYGGVLIVGADRRGLSLSILIFLRPGHPPLFIPWSEISVTGEKYLGFIPMTRLGFRREPSIPFRIYPRLAEKIEGAAGEAWPGAQRVGRGRGAR